MGNIQNFEIKTALNLRKTSGKVVGKLLDDACWKELNIKHLIIVSPTQLEGRKLNHFNQIRRKTIFPLVTDCTMKEIRLLNSCMNNNSPRLTNDSP